jgi:hypothetical protein
MRWHMLESLVESAKVRFHVFTRHLKSSLFHGDSTASSKTWLAVKEMTQCIRVQRLAVPGRDMANDFDHRPWMHCVAALRDLLNEVFMFFWS